MKTIDEFIEAQLNYATAAHDFKMELSKTLAIDVSHIKEVKVLPVANETSIKHMIQIHLTGANRFKSENVSKIEGLTIVTPNLLEIEVAEIQL